jgi:hypothetical protein
MAVKSKKRSSAFEDFPQNEVFIPNNITEEEILSLRPITQPKQAIVERIERLHPSQMMPDRFQPRRLLPKILRADYFDKKCDCYETARRWIALAKNEQQYKPTVDNLLNMGGSFHDHGQIKPITGSWIGQPDSEYLFVIETGERRFWAACLNRVINNTEDEPFLRVEVIQKPTRQRQVLENRHAEPPTAVGQACEIASLILSIIGITPDDALVDEYDYFRQALTLRMPAGLWNQIIPIMQLSRVRMVQLLNILNLPDPLLEEADIHRISERVLREVLALPSDHWEPALRAAMDNDLTSLEIAEITSNVKTKEKSKKNSSSFLPPERIAGSGLNRFARALWNLDDLSKAHTLDEIANDLVISGKAEGILNLLDELSRLVKIRISHHQD